MAGVRMLNPGTKASTTFSAAATTTVTVLAETAALGLSILAHGAWQGLSNSMLKTAMKQEASLVNDTVKKMAAIDHSPGTQVATLLMLLMGHKSHEVKKMRYQIFQPTPFTCFVLYLHHSASSFVPLGSVII